MAGINQESIWVAVIAGCAMLASNLLTGVLSFFSGKGKASADFQSALNNGFAELASELRRDKADCEQKLLALQGEVNGLRQHIYSLEGILRQHGIDVPPLRPIVPVFVLDSSEKPQ